MNTKKISDRLIHRLLKRIKKNKDMENPGIPVSAAIFYKNGMILDSANNLKSNQKPNYETHAEYILLNRFKPHEGKKYRIIVLSIPCKKCQIAINDLDWVQDVTYVTKIKGGNTEVVLEKELNSYVPNKKTIDSILEMLNIYFKFLSGSGRYRKACKEKGIDWKKSHEDEIERLNDLAG